MQDEVAQLVLRDNYEQAQAIYISGAQVNSMREVHIRYLNQLEASGALNRELEALPTSEALAERQGGLTLPELAILLSYTKNVLAEELLATDLPEDPNLAGELAAYFPTRLRERFAEQLQRHPLRREIIAGRVVNDLVNHCGTTFAFRLQDETGAGADDVVRAYTAARELFGMRSLWSEIESLDGKVPAQTQVSMFLKLRVPLERSARWLLRNRRRPLNISEIVARFGPGTSALVDALPSLDPSGREVAEGLATSGFPQQLAEHLAFADSLVPTLYVAEIAADSGVDPRPVAEVYFALGDWLDLNWLRERIVALPRDDRWEAMARAALRDDVYAEQAALTAEVMRSGSDGLSARDRIATWAAEHKDALERCLHVLGDIKAGAAADLAHLSVALREIRNLTQSTSAAPDVEPEEFPDLTPGARTN
jgi:glutamate dehydrogenase